MTAKLHQLNVSYIAAEDRLLLKASTSDQQEYRAWCTRRFTKILLDRLEILFEKEVDEAQVVPQQARKEVAQLQHGGSVSEQAFEKPYEAEPTSYPLGEEGLLLTKISYREQGEEVVVLTLSGDGDKGLTLNMDHKLRHNLYEILSRASRKADWFEDLDAPQKPVVH